MAEKRRTMEPQNLSVWAFNDPKNALNDSQSKLSFAPMGPILLWLQLLFPGFHIKRAGVHACSSSEYSMFLQVMSHPHTVKCAPIIPFKLDWQIK